FTGVVFEESSTATRAFSLKGLYMDPITDWPVTQIFISNIIAQLYSISQYIPWYSIIDYSGVAISIAIFFRILNLQSNWYLAIPFMVLVMDDAVLFSFTRTSMLLAAAGLFGMYYELNKTQKKTKWFFFKVII